MKTLIRSAWTLATVGLLALALAAAPQAATKTSTKTSTRTVSRTKSMPAPNLQLADLPDAVKSAVEDHTAGATIKSIHKLTQKSGAVCYKVDYVKGGKTTVLRLDENGHPMKDVVKTASAGKSTMHGASKRHDK